LFGPVGDQRYAGYARDILGSGQHLLELINDILDLSKAEAGRLELHEDEVEIGQVVQSAHRLIQDRAERARLQLVVDVDHDLPRLWADERKLTQILLNLLSNAVKFTLPGGRITVRATMDGSYRLALSVGDTGIGMTAADQSRALEPFGQVDSRLSRKYQGTGLGLPLVRAMTELHHGRLMIDSAPGRGTKVTVQFPVDRTILPRLAARQSA